MMYIPKSQHLSLARHTSASSFLFLWQQGRRLAVSTTTLRSIQAIGAADCAITGPLLPQSISAPSGTIAVMSTPQAILTHRLAIAAAPGAGGILPPGLLCAAISDPAKRVLSQRALSAIVTAIVLLSQCILPVGTIARESTTA